MERLLYNCFVRVFTYTLPFWLGVFELTVHQAMKERSPAAFLPPGLMLSSIAMLIPLCLVGAAPGLCATPVDKFRYRCDVALIAVAASLAVGGMPLWHRMLGASLSEVQDIGIPFSLFGWGAAKTVAVVYYFLTVGLSEIKRLTT
ncbi:hypothetical protein [Caballeronia sp. M1242]|uniref:hypothetical protein n=1 Tax=Caballeronia sp. M1242 TaxID=2814653 RepID=UPI0019D0751C|nr:hypothetical protein [Caballeronia sp. M1242]QSN61869.1 hypothetical protein JYK05_02845 [Caballeronia sp. M1242]